MELNLEKSLFRFFPLSPKQYIFLEQVWEMQEKKTLINFCQYAFRVGGRPKKWFCDKNKTMKRLDYPRVLFERKAISVALFLKLDFTCGHHYTTLYLRHPWKKNKEAGFKGISTIIHMLHTAHTAKDNHRYILTKHP